MRVPEIKVVILAGDHPSTPIVYNAVRSCANVQRVIIESATPRRQFLLRRVKKLGIPTVAGQILFKLLVVPYLGLKSRARLQQIKQQFGLDETRIDKGVITRVDSVNSAQTESLLRELMPDVVIINATRIITERILGCIAAPFVNMHSGITPKYRGVHGAYWALVASDTKACGVTVHLVDRGIDTGKALRRALIAPSARDNFVTYPLLQLGAGLPLLLSVLADNCAQPPQPPFAAPMPSKLWSHPTLFEYMYHRLAAGVK